MIGRRGDLGRQVVPAGLRDGSPGRCRASARRRIPGRAARGTSTGTAIRPLSSTVCRYSPVNTCRAYPCVGGAGGCRGVAVGRFPTSHHFAPLRCILARQNGRVNGGFRTAGRARRSAADSRRSRRPSTGGRGGRVRRAASRRRLGVRPGHAPGRAASGSGVADPELLGPTLRPLRVHGVQAWTVVSEHAEVVGDAEQVVARTGRRRCSSPAGRGTASGGRTGSTSASAWASALVGRRGRRRRLGVGSAEAVGVAVARRDRGRRRASASARRRRRDRERRGRGVGAGGGRPAVWRGAASDVADAVGVGDRAAASIPPLATTNATDTTNASARISQRGGGRRRHGPIAGAATGRRLAADGPAQVARAVDVAAASGRRAPAGGATAGPVRRSATQRFAGCGTSTGRPSAFVLVDGTQERADPGVRGPGARRSPTGAPSRLGTATARSAEPIGTCGGRPVAGSSYAAPSRCLRGWNGAESSTFRVLPWRTSGC